MKKGYAYGYASNMGLTENDINKASIKPVYFYKVTLQASPLISI
jgi:hypothetical protein